MHSLSGRSLRVLGLGVLLLAGQASPALATPAGSAPLTGGAVAAPAPSPSLAGGTLSAEPSILAATMRPGSTEVTKVTLRAAIDLDLDLAPVGLGQELDGGFLSLVPPQDGSGFSAQPYLNVAPRTLRMRAGQSRDVNLRIRVPKDAGEGTRYAALQVKATPVGTNGNIGIGLALGVSVIVTLADTVHLRTGALHDLDVVRPAQGEPFAISARLRNTGNTHYGAAPNSLYAHALLTDAAGRAVGEARTTFAANSLLPTFDRQIRLPFASVGSLVNGRYRITIEAGLEDGTILDSRTLDFEARAGEVLGATTSPATPTTPASPGAPGLLALVFAGLVGAMVAALAASAIAIRRRHPRAAAPAGSGGAAVPRGADRPLDG